MITYWLRIVVELLSLHISTCRAAVPYRRSGGAPLVGPPMPTLGSPPAPVPVAQPLGDYFAQKRVQYIPQLSANPTVFEVPVPAAPPPIIVNEIRVRKVLRERSCPSGETLDGDWCVSTEVCQYPTFLCPPRSVRDGVGCISVSRPTTECPVGQQLIPPSNPDAELPQCIKCELEPAEAKCPDGFSLSSANTCSKIEQSDPVCPVGFELSRADAGGKPRCLRSVPHAIVCPPDYQLANEAECAREHVFAAGLECPANATSERGECAAYVTPEAHCPMGYRQDGGLCLRELMMEPDPCAPGEELVPSDCRAEVQMFVCQKIHNTPPVRACPQGQWYDEEQQACILRVPQPAKCEAGYVLLDDGATCQRHILPDLHCQPGEVLHDGQCRVSVVVAALETCPPSTTAGANFCSRSELSRPDLMCLNGRSIGTGCVEEEVIGAAAYLCPVGYELQYNEVTAGQQMQNKPACVQTLQVPAEGSQQSGLRQSSSNSVHLDQYFESVWREVDWEKEALQKSANADGPITSVRNDKKTTNVAGNIDKTVEANQKAQHRYLQDRVQPEKDVSIAPRVLSAGATCREGVLVRETQCARMTVQAPVRTCPRGAIDETSHMCKREVVVPPAHKCPNGSTRQNNVCVQVESRPASTACPYGSFDTGTGVCAQQKPAQVQDARLLLSQTIQTCSSPSAQLRENGRENWCEDIRRTPQTFSCPPGSVPNGTAMVCVQTHPLIHPPQTRKTVQGEFKCPPASLRVGRQCHSTEIAAAKRVCPEGSFGDTQHCVVEAQPIQAPPVTHTAVPDRICPENGVLKGTSCLIQKRQDAKISCPDGFKLDGNRCVKPQPLKAVCPAGTTLQDNVCLREVRKPAFERLREG